VPASTAFAHRQPPFILDCSQQGITKICDDHPYYPLQLPPSVPDLGNGYDGNRGRRLLVEFYIMGLEASVKWVSNMLPVKLNPRT
jgi:hypothetical protein